jgi:hypothetical protein
VVAVGAEKASGEQQGKAGLCLRGRRGGNSRVRTPILPIPGPMLSVLPCVAPSISSEIRGQAVDPDLEIEAEEAH